MRLEAKEIKAITSAIKEHDPQAEIYLFGSRTDPNMLGGDIDILIFSQILEFSDKISILTRIFETMEEQKIDLIIAKDMSDPFVQLVMKTAIKL
jgi:predicted nucleotidyltransferase